MHILVAPIFVMTQPNGLATCTSEQQTGAICATPLFNNGLVTCTSEQQTGAICGTPVFNNGVVTCVTR